MIKTYISALLVVLLATVQATHAQQSMDDVFAQLDAANATGQVDDDAASAEMKSDGQESNMFDSLYEKGVARYKEGRYDEAISIFDAVLAIEYNARAIDYKKRAAERIVIREGQKQSVGRAQAMADINAAWNPEPNVFSTVDEAEIAAATDPDHLAVIQMEARLKSITIPVFDVAEATIEEVVKFFAETTRSQGGEDVDLLLVGMEEATAENNITISVDDMNLYEALQYVVEMASLKFEIKQNLVIIMPVNYVPASTMVMKAYDIIPEVGAHFKPANDADGGTGDLFDSSSSDGSANGPMDVSGSFSLVNFPEGSSAVYQPRFFKLFVKNTPKNLKVLETILADLSEEVILRRSQQVEINAKFVEFNEGALEELGFDWTVYGSGSVAGFEMDQEGGPYHQKSSGYTGSTGVAPGTWVDPPDGPPPVFVADQTLYNNPVTGQRYLDPATNPGNRPGENFFGSSQRDVTSVFDTAASGVTSTMGGVPSAMVFSNGDVDLRIEAMQQEGTADVLSAPRITTKSGSEATIRVAETHRYPQDYDVETGQRSPPIVRPQDWSDFDIGVTLTVTPVVDSESGTISLDLVPEILVFKGYDDYLTGINVYDSGGNTATDEFAGDGEPLLARMAAFERRSVQTQVAIADGHTVVMAGMVTEATETFRDQVPFIGDIPYLGRLFRTEGSRISKKNLTIFVKASLVDSRGMTRSDRELAQQ